LTEEFKGAILLCTAQDWEAAAFQVSIRGFEPATRSKDNGGW
jgi:hypothetical protein